MNEVICVRQGDDLAAVVENAPGGVTIVICKGDHQVVRTIDLSDKHGIHILGEGECYVIS